MVWTQDRARLAAHKRHHPDADDGDLRRDLRAARLADYIERTVAAAPPLTGEQKDRLALLLRPSNSEERVA
ncbi:MAG: hypothetical protein ACR2FF_04330 [Mycobacteriales bacterium]|nr:MAG: hypothetical protein DLM56_11065 [Pseudonocardiales bacterium]